MTTDPVWSASRVRTLESLKRPLTSVVDKAMKRFSVPGVSIGIVRGDDDIEVSRGVTCVEFPLDVDAKTMFQIGSTTKTYTGTVLMMLVEEGKIALDAPVHRYLPSFKLKDAEVAKQATIQHLVTHTGGWVGDYFDDLGRGDDALRKIVRRMASKTPQVTPLGKAWSYNNAGFYVLGRVLEEVSGSRYEDLVKHRIFEPLGMEQTFFFPEEVMTHKTAIGHLTPPDGEVQVARPWGVTRAAYPAGGIVSTVDDQLLYARFHLNGGKTKEGKRLLQASTIRSMQRELAPAGSMADAVGVTWLLEKVGRSRIVKHGGSINGHMSEFLMVPSEKFAITVLTNGSRGHELGTVVLDWALEEVVGVRRPEPTFRPLAPRAAREFVGRYNISKQADYDVTAEGDGLLLTYVPSKAALAANPQIVSMVPPPMPLGIVAKDKARVRGDFNAGSRVEFLRDDQGGVAFLRSGGRIYRKTSDQTG
jgi:CubicO group peptidase (beta-lactamase class C family)